MFTATRMYTYSAATLVKSPMIPHKGAYLFNFISVTSLGGAASLQHKISQVFLPPWQI